MRAESLIAVHGMQGGLYFWSYIYYLSKFYEFFDTILNVLKVCCPVEATTQAFFLANGLKTYYHDNDRVCQGISCT